MFTPLESIGYFEGVMGEVRVGDTVRCEAFNANNPYDFGDPLRYYTVKFIEDVGFGVLSITVHDWNEREGEDAESIVSVREGDECFLSVDHAFQVDAEGNLIRYWANLYELDRGYGGGEEGGWWYDCGTLKVSAAFTTREAAEEFIVKYREQNPDDGDYPLHSVCYRGGAYSMVVEEQPGADFPQEIPHYE